MSFWSYLGTTCVHDIAENNLYIGALEIGKWSRDNTFTLDFQTFQGSYPEIYLCNAVMQL